MIIKETPLAGAFVLEPERFEDVRLIVGDEHARFARDPGVQPELPQAELCSAR